MKTVVVGSSSSGKTQFVEGVANYANGSKGFGRNGVVQVSTGNLVISDTPGLVRFRYLINSIYCKDCSTYIVVYDINSTESLEEARKWCLFIKVHYEKENPIVLLLANKTDVHHDQWEAHLEMGRVVAQDHQCLFCECSATSGYNVNKALQMLIEAARVRDSQELATRQAKMLAKIRQRRRGSSFAFAFTKLVH